MEEIARRLVQGVGVPKDQQAGAGWLLRAAQHGSAQSAFNVGVMYERGFVVERDSTRAVEWYRKAADANLPIAKQHLALMLREGKGVARNGQEAIDLLRAASRQGLAVSMFTLGDIYERGDLLPKDPAMALAWYAITAEFDRQTNRRRRQRDRQDGGAARAGAAAPPCCRATSSARSRPASVEFKQIVEALRPPKPPPPLVPSALPPVALPAPALPPAAFPVPAPGKAAAADSEPDPPGWPKAANDQISAIQQALFDLKLLSDKPDGAIGPVTRAAIRAFQRSTGARETGEPTKDVFAALQGAIARRSAAASAPSTAPHRADRPRRLRAAAAAYFGGHRARGASASGEDGLGESRTANRTGQSTPAPESPPARHRRTRAPSPVPRGEHGLHRSRPPSDRPSTSVRPSRRRRRQLRRTSRARTSARGKDGSPRKSNRQSQPRRTIDPPKPPMPKIEMATATPPPIAATPEEPKPAPPETASSAAIDLGQSESPPAPPTSADIARAPMRGRHPPPTR